jgi:S-adenosylmethionine decarboxylase
MSKYNHFCEDNEQLYAGNHVLLDIYDGKHLDNIQIIEKAFNDAIVYCGASLLHMHFHHFGDGCGVSGVAVLQESHISIHTWKECEYAAIDIFLCGNLDPKKCIKAFVDSFETENIKITEIKRGIIS